METEQESLIRGCSTYLCIQVGPSIFLLFKSEFVNLSPSNLWEIKAMTQTLCYMAIEKKKKDKITGPHAGP